MNSSYLLVCVPVILLLSGCVNKAPETVVDNFLKAMQRGDRDAVQEYVTLSSRTLLESNVQPRAFSYQVVQQSVDDGRARVTVSFPDPKEPVKIPFILLQEEGAWRIDLRLTFQETLIQEGRVAIAKLAILLEGFTEAIKVLAEELPQRLNTIGKELNRAFEDLARRMEKALKELPRPSPAQ
jgi:hypothetical protein